MPQKLAALVLPLTVILLGLLLPGNAVAGPPEAVSGKMVLSTDKVAEALRRYQATRNADTRAAFLRKLAISHDRRVLNAIGEALNDREQVVRYEAAHLMVELLCTGRGEEGEIEPNERMVCAAKEVWRQYQREKEFAVEKTRRQAKQLPQ